MKIIAIVNQKGGSGKTTLTINLGAFFKQNFNVSLIDTDPQGSLFRRKDSLEKEGINIFKINKSIKEIRELPGEIFIVDTPPYLSLHVRDILKVADLALIPAPPGLLEIEALDALIHLIHEARKINTELLSGIFINKAKKNTILTKEIKTLISGYGIHIFDNIIGDRASFTLTVSKCGVFSSNDNKAKKELVDLGKEIKKYLLKTKRKNIK